MQNSLRVLRQFKILSSSKINCPSNIPYHEERLMSNQTDIETGPVVLELIKHAAVKSKEGQIFFGKCHADCFHKAHFMNIKMSSKADDQGFLTSTGRYVDRHEGAKIALASGQIDKATPHLFSEDLWSDVYKGKHDHDEIKGYIPREKCIICNGTQLIYNIEIDFREPCECVQA